MFATPVRRPIVANCPIVVNANGFFRPPRIEARRFSAQDFALAQGMLRGGGTDVAALSIRHQRAIPKRPHAGPIGHFKEFIHQQPAAFLWAWEPLQQRIRRGSGGPDQRLGEDRAAVAQLDARSETPVTLVFTLISTCRTANFRWA